ncbi:MAG: hypothetical protein K2X48_12235 [Chitinophagaceae bacterium]|nr:hypothetical protein [Chitinophagaceae bacterium]
MRKYLSTLFICLIVISGLCAQQKRLLTTNQLIDLTVTAGSSQQSIATSYVFNRGIGKSKKFEIGLGVRNTAYFGVKKDFWTAPANLARTTTFPFAVVFAGQKTENWDTLNVQRPFTNSLNATVNLGYHLSNKFYAGFNIDLIGFTVGRKSPAVFTSNGVSKTEPAAKPAAFNLLLTGDNDYGSLNSEFFLRYQFNKKNGVLKECTSFYLQNINQPL